MKKILLLCLTTLFSLSLFAQEEDEEVYCLAVSIASSTEVDYFALDANPVATFGEGTLSITQDGEGVISIVDMALTDVEEWYFCDAVPGVGEKQEEPEPEPEPDPDPDTGTGIGGVSAGGSQINLSAGQVLMTGLEAGAQVYVYAADGQTVNSVVASSDGRAVVDLNSLKSGQVYILRTPSASYKIAK